MKYWFKNTVWYFRFCSHPNLPIGPGCRLLRAAGRRGRRRLRGRLRARGRPILLAISRMERVSSCRPLWLRQFCSKWKSPVRGKIPGGRPQPIRPTLLFGPKSDRKANRALVSACSYKIFYKNWIFFNEIQKN